MKSPAPIDLDVLCAAIAESLGMAVDPRRLKPADLIRAVNSTPLGAVLDGRRLRRHRDQAGFRIGDDRTLDLVRYVAWLAGERHQEKTDEVDDAYELLKERARERNRKMALSGRDLANGIPPWIRAPENLERRRSCERNLQLFCETYHAATFNLTWSEDHLLAIRKIELAVLEGGLFALAMPRGSGKTTLVETAAEWALLYGHRSFVAIIAADQPLAITALDSIKMELETNDLLDADFSEVTGPIRALEGISQRAAGQLYRGQSTHLGWKADEIILASIGSLEWEPFNGEIPRSCGAAVKVAGITGRIRGMKSRQPTGANIRPDLALIDDPQTDESAMSPSQCAARERVINGAVLGLAGPGRKIAALAAITVVRQDDMADRMLDRKRNPQWHGERTRMMRSMPTDLEKWEEYSKLRKAAHFEDRLPTEANAFYAKHQKAMDAGAVASWPARRNPDELNAIQNAMNLLCDHGEQAFWAEYQNEPLPELKLGNEQLKTDEILTKLAGRARGIIPIAAQRLTAFVDVQGNALFWLVVAWDEAFGGTIVDYGTEPEQGEPYFALSGIKRTLRRAAPGSGKEAAIVAGLIRLADRILGRDWQREDRSVMRITRCLVDANWGESTNLVYEFCRGSKHAAVLIPSHGRGIGAAAKPLNEYDRKPGDRVGLNWRQPAAAGRVVRHVIYDANYWKSFARARLQTPLGDRGGLTLFGQRADQHRLLADHLTAEHSVETTGRGRTVEEWRMKPGATDNHWWDCLVGACVAASMEGIQLATAMPAAQRKRVRLSEIQGRRWTPGGRHAQVS